MSDLARRLIEHWSAQGIPANPGVPEEMLRTFDGRTGLALPADIRAYFAYADGMSDAHWCDRTLFRFWRFAEFESAGTYFRGDRFLKDQATLFLFACHSLVLPAFAIRLSSDPEAVNPILAIYSDNRDYEARIVARSFTEFVEVYLAPENKWLDLLSGESVATLKLPPDRTHPLFDAELDTHDSKFGMM